VLVVLAVVVGGLVSLYLVRQSPWLAEKILKEQKIQAVEDGKDPPAAPSDAAVSSSDTGGSTATAGVSAPRSEVVSDTAERLDSVPPVMVAVPSPRLDPVVAQRIGQMQQWAIILQGLPAGPIDPSAALPTVLTATGDSTSDSAPAASDRPVKIVPTPAIGSQDNPAPDSSAAATPDPVVVDPFGTRLGRWFDGALESTGRFLGSLVRVQQVEDTTLAGQSQAFFAQVNQRAQSHLLSARLLMLHDQHRLAGEELGALLELLRRYYDPADVRVTKMRDEVSQLRAALKEPA
jgi:hypothetical protein